MDSQTWIAVIVVILTCLLIIFVRLATWIVMVYLSRRYKVTVKIGRLGLLCMHNVTLCLPNKTTVAVDKLQVSSSYWNKHSRKPIELLVSDVRVQIELGNEQPASSGLVPSETSPAQSEVSYPLHNIPDDASADAATDEPSATTGAFLTRGQWWAGWLQHIGIHLDNVNLLILKGLLSVDGLLHVKADKAEADCTLDVAKLFLTLSIDPLSVRILRNVAEKDKDRVQGCVASASICLITTATANLSTASAFPPLTSIDVVLSKPSVHITEDLFTVLPGYGRRLSFIEDPSAILRETLLPNAGDAEYENSRPRVSDPWRRISCLPARMKFSMNDVAFLVARQEPLRDLSLSIKLAEWLSVLDKDSQSFESKLRITDIDGKSVRSKFLKLLDLQADGKITPSKAHLRVASGSPYFHYMHEDFSYWSEKLQSVRHNPSPAGSSISHSGFRLPDFLSGFQTVRCDCQVAGFEIRASLEGEDTARTGFSQLSVSLKSTMKKGSSDDAADSPSLLRYGRSTTCSSSVQRLWCLSSKSHIHPGRLSASQHMFRTVFFVYSANAKVTINDHGVKLDAVTDGMQAAWSPEVARQLDLLFQAMAASRSFYWKRPAASATTASIKMGRECSSSPSTEGPNAVSALSTAVQLQVNCSDVNIFAYNEDNVGLMCRIDNLSVDCNHHMVTLVLHGSKITFCRQTGKQAIALVASNNLQDHICHIKKACVVANKLTLTTDIKLEEEVTCEWTTDAHLCLMDNLRSAMALKDHFMFRDVKESRQRPVSSTVSPWKLLRIRITAALRLVAKLSSAHRVSLSAPELSLTADDRTTYMLHAPGCVLAFDDRDIFQFHIPCLRLVKFEPRLSQERKQFKELWTQNNRAIDIGFEALIVTFPAHFNFAACFEELVNIVKWVKKVHKLESGPFKQGGKLPPDIILRTKTTRVRIMDDSFEVKLGENYALMVDEFLESEKRKAALQRRIDDLQAKHLISAEKLDELVASLESKDAQIYIQRSKQLQASTNMAERHLFEWTLHDVEIMAMADESFHGMANAVKQLKDVDSQSPLSDDVEFLTLWCRMVSVKVKQWLMTLRDYPQPFIDSKDLHIWGRLMGAEQLGAPRAVKTCAVEVGLPWETASVDRNMPALKFYHDLSADVSTICIAYGACWENTLAEFNLSTDLINAPSVDPSQPLPFWDKARLLLHGRLTVSVQQMHWLYHASFDPYNTTELMDWTWTNLLLDWTNGLWVFNGNLDIFTKTASKYDDCRLLHLPNLTLRVILEWVTFGNPNDHHSVMPCAPDKVPEFSMGEHDSYRAFRSQNLNVGLQIQTTPPPDGAPLTVPSCTFYSSTLKFLDQIKACMLSTTRPTRRGTYFRTKLPMKPTLSRHSKRLNLRVDLHRCRVAYRISHSHSYGLEAASGQRLFVEAVLEHLVLPTTPGGNASRLRRRAPTEVKARKCSASVSDVCVHLLLNEPRTADRNGEVASEGNASTACEERTDFLVVERLSYDRADAVNVDAHVSEAFRKYTHHLQIENLKLAWTMHNRNVAFGILESYRKSNTLKKNISASALKVLKAPTSQTRISRPRQLSIIGGHGQAADASRTQSDVGRFLLDQLTEGDTKLIVCADGEEPQSNVQEQLRGIAACQKDDVTMLNWQIDVNHSQVRFHGVELGGYVIISAARAQFVSRDHHAVWYQNELKGKTTWMGSVDSMQYCAATSTDKTSRPIWLSKENIGDLSTSFAERDMVAEMRNGGNAAGGLIYESVSLASGLSTVQLQRIISRCRCQLFYAYYGDVDLETAVDCLPPPPAASSDMLQQQEGMDTFTLLHHDVCVSTNSAQYALVMDITNNLLLYVEPKKKEALERLQKMIFKLQLFSEGDQKTPVLNLQNSLRSLLVDLRKYEKDLYMLRKAYKGQGDLDVSDRENLEREIQNLDSIVERCKEDINGASADLALMVSCYNQSQLQNTARLASYQTIGVHEIRRNELCFLEASWRLTDVDGQVGMADTVLKNFLYTRINNNDDSGSHQLELGWVKVTNLMPPTPFKDVLAVQERSAAQLPLSGGGRLTLRILSRDKAPVGGIAIKEHFEVNVVPMTIQLTYHFFKRIMDFFFPYRSEDGGLDKSGSLELKKKERPTPSGSSTPSIRTKSQTSSMQTMLSEMSDLDKMKERAAKTNMFLYIKVPEVPLRVSYKGSKEKNIEDLNDFLFMLPTLEYHNQRWTWQDFVEQVKVDMKKVLLSQAIKQKLRMKSKFYVVEDSTGVATSAAQDNEKAKLLLGDHLQDNLEGSKSKKKSFFRK